MRLDGVQEVAGSNPVSPIFSRRETKNSSQGAERSSTASPAEPGPAEKGAEPHQMQSPRSGIILSARYFPEGKQKTGSTPNNGDEVSLLGCGLPKTKTISLILRVPFSVHRESQPCLFRQTSFPPLRPLAQPAACAPRTPSLHQPKSNLWASRAWRNPERVLFSTTPLEKAR